MRLLCLGVFVVMLAWTLDKIISPGHAARVFENFHFISGLESGIFVALGVIELVIIVSFVVGFAKKFTYRFVLVVHAVSTFSSWKQYIIDINLLFFAAWPMLAACIALYMLQDQDVKWIIGRPKAAEIS